MPKLGNEKVKVKNSALFVDDGSPTGKKISTLNEGMKKLAECGCGTVCDCYSYTTLYSLNSTTGEWTQVAIYVIDGAIKVDTVENAIAEQKGILEG